MPLYVLHNIKSFAQPTDALGIHDPMCTMSTDRPKLTRMQRAERVASASARGCSACYGGARVRMRSYVAWSGPAGLKGSARPGKQGGADPSAAAAPLRQLSWIVTELPRRTGRRSRKRLRLMASMSAIAQAPRRPRCGLCIELKIKHGGLLATATAAELQPRCRSTDSFDGIAVALPTAPAVRLQPRSSRESAPVEEGRRRGGVRHS